MTEKPAKKAAKKKAKKKTMLCIGHNKADAAKTLSLAEGKGFALTAWAPGATFLSDGPFDAVFDPGDVLGRASPQSTRQVLERMADDAEIVDDA